MISVVMESLGYHQVKTLRRHHNGSSKIIRF